MHRELYIFQVVANHEYHNKVVDLLHLLMNYAKHPNLQFHQGIDFKNIIIFKPMNTIIIIYLILYLFKPTAGIETLESDAERLKDSSSPRGALPSGMVTLSLLIGIIKFKSH